LNQSPLVNRPPLNYLYLFHQNTKTPCQPFVTSQSALQKLRASTPTLLASGDDSEDLHQPLPCGRGHLRRPGAGDGHRRQGATPRQGTGETTIVEGP